MNQVDITNLLSAALQDAAVKQDGVFVLPQAVSDLLGAVDFSDLLVDPELDALQASLRQQVINAASCLCDPEGIEVVEVIHPDGRHYTDVEVDLE